MGSIWTWLPLPNKKPQIIVVFCTSFATVTASVAASLAAPQIGNLPIIITGSCFGVLCVLYLWATAAGTQWYCDSRLPQWSKNHNWAREAEDN